MAAVREQDFSSLRCELHFAQVGYNTLFSVFKKISGGGRANSKVARRVDREYAQRILNKAAAIIFFVYFRFLRESGSFETVKLPT